MPSIRICNWCGTETRDYKLVEAMDGGTFAVCRACEANPCIGCEYEDGYGDCVMPFCIVSSTLARPAEDQEAP